MGHRLCPALCGGVLRFCCLSLRLCAMDGKQAVALRRPHCRSPLPAGAPQYVVVRRPRREREDVPGFAAVRLLHAAALVDQSVAVYLYCSLGDRGGTSLRLVSLDAAAGGPGRRHIVDAVRDRRSDLVQRPLAWDRLEHYRLHLEMDAVLDRDIPRRADADTSGNL